MGFFLNPRAPCSRSVPALCLSSLYSDAQPTMKTRVCLSERTKEKSPTTFFFPLFNTTQVCQLAICDIMKGVVTSLNMQLLVFRRNRRSKTLNLQIFPQIFPPATESPWVHFISITSTQSSLHANPPPPLDSLPFLCPAASATLDLFLHRQVFFFSLSPRHSLSAPKCSSRHSFNKPPF